ncbi:MAG: ABC transporter permease [Pseudomonadota bacterium]
MKTLGKITIAFVGLVVLWGVMVAVFQPPNFVVPSPARVGLAFVERWQMLLTNAAVTATEIVLGLLVGLAAGVTSALAIAATPALRRLVLPVIVVTQTLPVFAIAPLLVIWLGYGMASKIVMAALIIYFPIATAYAEAMSRVPQELIDLARLNSASKWQLLWLVRAPAGLPGLIAGVKVAATVAHIGAVVGEWVGASAGLGYVMLHANARLQTDVLFAALMLLAALALIVRFAVDRLVDRLLPWQTLS